MPGSFECRSHWILSVDEGISSAYYAKRADSVGAKPKQSRKSLATMRFRPQFCRERYEIKVGNGVWDRRSKGPVRDFFRPSLILRVPIKFLDGVQPQLRKANTGDTIQQLEKCVGN